jgi:hypothetical protein
MNKPLVWIAVLFGIVFLVLAATYFVVPAGSLPTFMPGFVAGSARTHFKHGVGSLILALALFALAWFQSGSKKA